MESMKSGASTVTGAIDWAKKKSASHELEGPKAKNWITAAEQLSAMKTDDEPDDAEWALANAEELGRRYAIKNGENRSDTASAYVSRVRAMLAMYLEYLRNPSGFHFPSAKPRPKKTTTAPNVTESKTRLTDVDTTTRKHTYYTKDGRPIVVEIPLGTNMADLNRFCYFVMTLAADFIPPTPAPPNVTATLTE
jgi:hypothetical protein